MYTSDTVSLLKKTYVWSTVDATDIDEARYLLCKKFSEVRDSHAPLDLSELSLIR